MIGDDEKRVLHQAEQKGFRLERVGAAEDRYYVIDVASGVKMPSDVLGHPYSFTLEEAKLWLEAREDRSEERKR